MKTTKTKELSKEDQLKQALQEQQETQKFVKDYQELCKKHGREIIPRLQKIENDSNFGFTAVLSVAKKIEEPKGVESLPKATKKKVETPKK